MGAGGIALLAADGTALASFAYGEVDEPERDEGAAAARFRCGRGGDARLELAEPALAAALRARLPRPRRPWRRALPVAAVTLAGLGALWGALAGLPPLLAPWLPAGATARLGAGVEAALLRGGRVCVEPAGLAALTALLARLAPPDGGRAGGAPAIAVWEQGSPNALALPGGRLVVTSGLIARAPGPEALAGVLAHELGHRARRHPEQGLVRALGLQGAASLLAGGGDLGRALAGSGSVLALLAYSRAAEREADAFALRALAEAGLPAAPLGALLRDIGGRGGAVPDLLRTHPATPERLAALAAAAPPAAPGPPALPPEGWAALKTVCREARPYDAARAAGPDAAGG